MNVTDPIADLLTRVRNAVKANKRKVDVPCSNLKKGMVEILKQQKFINDYAIVEDNKQNVIRILLKYSGGNSAITGLKRVSRPGLRQYANAEALPRVYNGYGIAIISTSKGLMTDKQARLASIGGEVICYVW